MDRQGQVTKLYKIWLRTLTLLQSTPNASVCVMTLNAFQFVHSANYFIKFATLLITALALSITHQQQHFNILIVASPHPRRLRVVYWMRRLWTDTMFRRRKSYNIHPSNLLAIPPLIDGYRRRHSEFPGLQSQLHSTCILILVKIFRPQHCGHFLTHRLSGLHCITGRELWWCSIAQACWHTNLFYEDIIKSQPRY